MLYYFILHSKFHVDPKSYSIDFGWGNGYVLIPKGHKLYGVHYDSIDIYAHGGLTYSNNYDGWIENYLNKGYDYELGNNLRKRIDEEGYDFLKDYWVIGFDTGHHGDSLKNCTKEYVFNEAKKLYQECFNSDPKYIRKLKLEELEKK